MLAKEQVGILYSKIETRQRILRWVLDKHAIDLTANAFIKLMRMSLGSINKMRRQIESKINMYRIHQGSGGSAASVYCIDETSAEAAFATIVLAFASDPAAHPSRPCMPGAAPW